MRIIRFSHEGDVAFGVVEGDPPLVTRLAGHPFGDVAVTGQRHPLSRVRLLAPILPSKVVAIGKNYADHIAEMAATSPTPVPPANPLIFIKPSTSVIGEGDSIRLPPSSQEVHLEGELAAVIGRPARNVSAAEALAYVLGYACANDVTARDQQRSDVQFTRAKGYDSFCPLGPWMETELDPSDLHLVTRVNGEIRQDARTSQMIHDLPTQIAFISEVMTLLPGDVILTGTPAGVGPILNGESVSVQIEGIGTLTNPVTAT